MDQDFETGARSLSEAAAMHALVRSTTSQHSSVEAALQGWQQELQVPLADPSPPQTTSAPRPIEGPGVAAGRLTQTAGGMPRSAEAAPPRPRGGTRRCSTNPSSRPA
jgi:hypothetical protein